MTFTVHTTQTAPAESAPLLKEIQADKGYIPNLLGVMAGSPAVLAAFLQLDACMCQSSFTNEERDIVLLAASYENHSEYCKTAHTQQAEGHGLSAEITDAVKSGRPLQDKKLEALRKYTLAVMQNKGRPEDNVIDAFLDAGYKPRQALEIVLGITLKTLTNYTYRLAHPEIDPALHLAAASDKIDRYTQAT